MPHFPSPSDRDANSGPVFTEISPPPGLTSAQRIPELPPAMTASRLQKYDVPYYLYGVQPLKKFLLNTMLALLFQEELISFLAPTAALTGVTPAFLLDRLFAIGDPLGNLFKDYEDLYYALLAKVKDLHEQLRLRVNNGFLTLDRVLHFRGSHPPDLAGTARPFKVLDLVELLEYFWKSLNDARVVKPLNDMVKLQKRPQGQKKRGLEFLGDWAPGMIAAYLNEKFRVGV